MYLCCTAHGLNTCFLLATRKWRKRFHAIYIWIHQKNRKVRNKPHIIDQLEQKKKKKKKSQTKKWRMLGSSHATRISQSRSRSGDACGIQGARHNPFHLFFFLKRRQSAFRSSNLEHIVITRAMRVEKETHNKRLIYIELIKEEYPLE
jgi:hypothetical protein